MRGALLALLVIASRAFAQPYTPGVQVKQGTSLIGQCPTLNFDSTDFSFTKSGSTCTGQLGADIPHTGPYDTGTNFDPTNGVTSVPAVPFNFGSATSFTLPTTLVFGGNTYTLPSSRSDTSCLKTGSGGTQGTLTWGSCGGGGLSDPATIDTDASGTLYGTSQAGGNLILDANSGDTAGEIQLESLVRLWPSLGTPAASTTTRLMQFNNTITKSNSSNAWILIDISPTLTWGTISSDYSVINQGGTITNTVAPTTAYEFSIFKNQLSFRSSTNAAKPFVPDTLYDVSGMAMMAGAATESVRGAVTVMSGKQFGAQGGDYTLSGNAEGAGHPNDIGLEYWPSFAATGTSTLTFSGAAAAVYLRAPSTIKDAGATLTLSGRLAAVYLEDVLSPTNHFSTASSLYSLGANVSLINAGPAYIGAVVDPAGAAYKLGVGGHLYLDNNTNAASELRFREPDGASHTETSYAAIKAPALGASYTLTLPVDDGNAGDYLKTDGNGVLSWVAPSETKCLTIDQPVNTDDVIWFKNQSGAAITLTSANCIVAAATSATVQIKECDVNAATCGNSHTAVACTTSNTPITLTDTAVDSDDWMRVAVTATSGSPGHVTVCLTYSGAS